MRLAPGARRRALAVLALAVPATLVAPLAGLVVVALAAGVRWFYRDPERHPPDAGAVSPADGRVSVVREEGDRLRVGVFMSPADVHVNRAPLPGTVEGVAHEPGGHWPAFSKASERNERLHVEADDWRVTLIAGTVARRTTAYVESGAALDQGERLGHIAFGSRADVLLPPRYDHADLAVDVGDRVRAGESVIAARLGDDGNSE